MEQRGQITASVGVGRKLVVLALLAGGAAMADQLLVGSEHFGPPGLLASGFAILFAFSLGQLAVRLHMPSVTGYLAAGVLLGPALRNMLPPSWLPPPLAWPVIDASLQAQLQPAESVAAGIIAMTAGASLRLARLRGLGRPVVGALLGQLVAVFLTILLWVVLVGLGLPRMTMPGFESVPLASAVGFAALAACLALAGSPAATLAVLHGTGARGVVSRLVLTTVVLKELLVVLMFVAMAMFVQSPSGHPDHEVSTTVLVRFLLTAALGVVFGAGATVYLRAVRRQVPLFLLASVAVAVFVAGALKLPPVPLLITAGLVVGQLAPTSELLVRDVTKIATPVFLAFFMLFGARLRLDLLVEVAPFALVLVLLRAMALRLGVSVGTRLLAEESTRLRYTWLGFLPQAGVALPLAAMMDRSLGEPGKALAALTLASVACNELVGPVLLRFGLARSGELPSRVVRGQDATEQETESAVTGTSEPPREPAEPVRRAQPWPRTQGVDNPWGPPPAMTSPQLNDLLLEFEADLQGLARDVASGRMDAFRKDALAYLRQLRMELLRHHRRVSNKVVAADPETVRLDALLRGEHSELAERWGAVALARGARVGIDTWSPMAIVEAVDRLADEVPEFVEAPFEPESFHHPQDESAFRWLRRLGLRAQWRWARMTDGAVPVRSVAVGTLLRYHLTGTLPARLEGLAALLVDAERQLVDRTRELFDGASLAYSALAQSVQGMGDDPELRSRLSALRRHMEEELAAATKEVNQIVEDGAVRGACILGEGLKSIKQEMPRMSTLDLPTFSRRFSSVHAERTRAVRRLSEGYEQARKVVAAQYAMLALEFEMGSLEARIRDAVETFASELGRSMEGRAHLQLTRIAQALDETIPRYERLFETELAGVDLASELRNEAKPLERVVAEAARASLQLRDQLTDDQAVAPLLDSVARAARTLTDRYRIPSGRPARGEWRLPALVPVVEVPFRQVVQTHLESSVSPALLHVMREQAAAVHPLVTSLEELERRVSFNIEVAVAEIDEYQTETVPPETRAFVRDMVMGALQRSRASFADIEEKSAGWAVAARTGVHKAVLGGIEELRWQIVEGQAAELRSRLLSRATSPLRLIEDARRLPAVLRKARRDFTQAVRLAVGGDRIERARQYLGLPVLSDSAPLDPSVLAAPSGKLEHLPLVYRRLFSAQALEAGDLLVGRAPAISRARKALSGESGKRLRSVALIGADGVGKGAVANAILRGFDVQRIDTLSLTAPATVDEVEAWFAPRREGRTIALNGFYWLFAACPGGLEPLRRFVAGVVADKGRNAWMVRSDALTWAFAARLAPVLDAFAEVVELEPFDVEQLKAAVLARHGMSGYRLEFGRPEEEQGPLQRAIVSSLRNVRTHQSWFRALHRASGGLIRDALVLWMASVEAVDDSAGVVRMGKVPPPPTNALRRLPEEVLLTLWQTSRNGWTDPRVHAELFRMALSASEAHLHRMEHIGLLQSKDGRYRITVHLRGALHRVLAERGWLA